MKRNTFTLIAIGVCIAGCTSVELQYQSPAQHGKFAAIAKQATDQYQYVELSEMYVRVAPDATEAKPKAADGAAPAAADAAAKPAKARPAAASDVAPATPAPSVSGKKEKAPKKAAGAPAAKTDAVSATPKPAAGSETKPVDDSKPKPLDPTLASATIDGKKWTATVVPVPSSAYGFMVRGVSGFWRSTTISISRYDNSNVASSISSKAENLVAKRLGQFAGVAVSLVKLGAAGVADVVKPPAEPLLPFSLKIPSGNDNGKLNNGWTWAFEYDADEPSGTVTFEEFMSGVASNKVAYWPVPACRSGVLSVFPPSNDPVKYQYSFNVVVSSPEYVRLQSIPIDGKLSPGVVCSASETGTTTADPLQTVSDDLAALQQGVQKVKAAKKPPAVTPAVPAASADKQK